MSENPFQHIVGEERARMKRIMSGDADNDLIRRGDVLNVLRDLRTNPCKPSEYQRALGDVTRALYRLSGPSA